MLMGIDEKHKEIEIERRVKKTEPIYIGQGGLYSAFRFMRFGFVSELGVLHWEKMS